MDEDKVYFKKDIFRILWISILLIVAIGAVYWLDDQYQVLAATGERFTQSEF